MNISPIRVSIVEDNPEVMDFLKGIFESSERFECLQTLWNPSNAIYFLPKSDVDVVIVDIKFSGKLSGIDCVREVKEMRPDILFMMYTQFEEDDLIFESLKAGASGYLVKSEIDEDWILNSVEEIYSGGSPMSSSIARRVTDFFFKGHGNFKELELLGKREKEVLKLLSQGLMYKEIANELGIVVGTVKVHINKIYKKLHVQNRTEAVNKYLGRKF